MKVKRTGSPEIHAADLGEIIISTWRGSGSTSVGEQELAAIQDALPEEMSPARIARELADAGAALRHPEVIEYDSRWRERQIAQQMKPFAGLGLLQKREPLKLRDAEATIAELEALRLRLTAEEDEVSLDEIRRLTIEARHLALKRVNDASLSSSGREEQAEIAEWLRVWLETPAVFAHWVELRKASQAFIDKFAAH